jgi:hypothetical protein
MRLVSTTKKADRQILVALLSMPVGKLTPSEKRVFQEMFDKVETGAILRLSPKQRMWIESVYDKNDLDKAQPPPKNIQVKDKSLFATKHPLDLMPRPLKPPGRT